MCVRSYVRNESYYTLPLYDSIKMQIKSFSHLPLDPSIPWSPIYYALLLISLWRLPCPAASILALVDSKQQGRIEVPLACQRRGNRSSAKLSSTNSSKATLHSTQYIGHLHTSLFRSTSFSKHHLVFVANSVPVYDSDYGRVGIVTARVHRVPPPIRCATASRGF